MKFNIYLYEGDLKTHGLSEKLAMEAVTAYCMAKGIECRNLGIGRTELGKPYAEGLTEEVKFSISHTQDMWICVVGGCDCGIDLQTIKELKWEEISARYYNQKEQEYVRLFGKEGFFQIWTHREAYGKLTGEGFFGKRPSFVDENILLSRQVGGIVETESKTGQADTATGTGFGSALPRAYFIEIPIANDIFCTFCSTDPEAELEF